MHGSRGALIILGILGLSTLGCLPTPSVGGEIGPSGKWYGRGPMVHIPFPGPYLKDEAFAGFSSQNGCRFEPSLTT